MSSAVPVQQGGVVVVTQMYPAPSQGGVVCNPIPQQMSTGTSTFSRVHPIALGTVQILIGLMVFLFGVVTIAARSSVVVLNGFFVMGAGFYITAGSLTVAAGKSSNRCLVLGQGISGVLAVFNFLEFIITIVVSAFACKCTCDCCKQQQPVYVVPGNTSMAPQAQATYSAPATVVQLPLQDLPTYPAAPTSMAHPPPQVMSVSNPADGQRSPGFSDPPEYSEEIKGF